MDKTKDAIAAQAKREAASLLGVDADNLSPADTLRCDLISTLRLVIDDAGATVLNGSSTDLGRLITATESLIALLPNRELPKPALPADDPNDPRKIMHETYFAMRRRGEIAGPEFSRDAALKRIAELEAEVERLRSGVITPPTADIVPPGEALGEFYVGGPRPGPDDPPVRSTAVIEHEASATPAPPQPQPPRALRVGEQWDPVKGCSPIPPAPPKSAVPPAPAAPQWDDTPGGRAWQAWHDAGGGGYDPWADNR